MAIRTAVGSPQSSVAGDFSLTTDDRRPTTGSKDAD